METDVAAEVDTVDGAASVFDEARDGFAHNRGVKVTNVKNLERVRIGEFGDDDLVGVCAT